MSDLDPLLKTELKTEPVTVESDADVAMQSYPSPTVESHDNGPFYPQTPHQDDQTQEDLNNTQQDGHEQLAEPPTPRQAARGVITSAEELQLAAQLSQGLAHGLPMMDTDEDPNMQHVMTQDDIEQHEQALQHHDEQMTNGHEPMQHEDLPQHHHDLAQHPDGLQHQEDLQDHHGLQHEEGLQPQGGLHQELQHQELQHQELQEGLHHHEGLEHQDAMQHQGGLQHQEELQQQEGLQHQQGLQQQEEQLHDQLHDQLHEHLSDHDRDMTHAQHEQHEQHLQHEHNHAQHQHELQHQQDIQHQPLQHQDLQHQNLQHQDLQHQQDIPHQQDIQHQYIPDQHQHQPHLQPAAAMDSMVSPYQIPDNNVPPRKRSKVSRACDECRRKKVKCDAPSETGEEPCSNCRRSNMRCLFSRIPQKRGPSKGYIKELADRIHSIEGKLASEGANADLNELLNGSRRDSGDLFQTSDASNRKRPYSSISGGEFDTPTSGQFSPQPRTLDRYRPPYSANGLAPTPLAAKPDAGTPSRAPAVIDEMGLDLNHHMDQINEIDETIFAAYLTLVHPYFPVLAASKSRLETQLAQCAPILRDAFTTALHGTIESFPSFNVEGGPRQALTNAYRSLTEWELDPSPRSRVADLVHLQTLILIVISSDNYGPASIKGEQGSPSKPMTLGRAVGLANSMRLHISQANANLNGEFDSDSDENVAVRAWWTLIMLDRWNAISTASTMHIPNDSVVILPVLKDLLGENVYHLARLSNILGHFVPVALAPPKTMILDPGAAAMLSSFLNLSMELFREVLPASITPTSHPVLHLVYWHSRLLAYLFQTNAKSSDIMWPCKELVALLNGNPQLLNPLNHHFFSLTALTLLELANVETERELANSLLKELLETQVAPSNWDNIIRDRILEQMRPSTSHAAMEATASQSLQHLADLATATEIDSAKPEKDAGLRTSDTYEQMGFDPRELTRGGYLNVIATRPSAAR